VQLLPSGRSRRTDNQRLSATATRPTGRSGFNHDTDTPTTMPIFEYACQDCHHEFETLVRSDTVPTCPQCHSVQLEKKLSVFAAGSGTPERAPAMAGPCGSCGHPGGPGSCAMH